MNKLIFLLIFMLSELYAEIKVNVDYTNSSNDAYFLKEQCDQKVYIECKRLGELYYNGQNVEQNYDKAIEYYKKACYGDDYYIPSACTELGTVYYHDLKSKDLKTIVGLYERGCKEGDPIGCVMAGILYEEDFKNIEQAIKFYKIGCNGDGVGCTLLGKIYEEGKGVKKDLKKAKEFYKHACDNEMAPDEEGCQRFESLK